jgi:hypothetical protein
MAMSAAAGKSAADPAFRLPEVGMSIADGRTPEGEALDAYSQVVTTVAERLTPSVASLRVIQRDGRGRGLPGAGSGVVIPPASSTDAIEPPPAWLRSSMLTGPTTASGTSTTSRSRRRTAWCPRTSLSRS